MCLCDDAAGPAWARACSQVCGRGQAARQLGTYHLPHLGPGRGCHPISRLPSGGNQRQWRRWVRGPFAWIPPLWPSLSCSVEHTRHHCVKREKDEHQSAWRQFVFAHAGSFSTHTNERTNAPHHCLPSRSRAGGGELFFFPQAYFFSLGMIVFFDMVKT